MIAFVDEQALNQSVAELRALATKAPANVATLLMAGVGRLGTSLRALSDEEALDLIASKNEAPAEDNQKESASVQAMRAGGAFDEAPSAS